MIISIITISAFSFFIIVAIYYGGLRKIKITEVVSDDFLLVFKEHKGDYKNIKNVMDKVYEDLIKKSSIQSTKGFGIYLDDPLYVEKEDLKSIGGCIIESDQEEILKKIDLDGLKTYKLTKRKAVYTSFPFNGNFSIVLALLKVYPKLTKYFEKKNIDIEAIMEVYDIPQNRIDYYCFENFNKEFFESLFKSNEE